GRVVGAELGRWDDQASQMAKPRLGRLAKTSVTRDAAADDDRRDGPPTLTLPRKGGGKYCGLDPLQEGVDDRFLVAGGQVGALLLTDRLAFADLVEQGGLDAAEAEVQSWCPRARERDGLRVAARRQFVDRGAAGKGQAQNARALVEGFSSGVVARPADHGDLAVRLPSDEVTVATGDDQPEHRRADL